MMCVESEITLKADAFVNPYYHPHDDETEEKINSLARELGFPEKKKYAAALSSFIVACKVAEAKGSKLISFSGNANYYDRTSFGYPIAKSTRDALIEHGFLKAVQAQKKGSAIVYEVSNIDTSGSFTSKIPWPILVREKKKRTQSKGIILRREACKKRFRGSYREAECRMKKLNRFYAEHPLSSPDGNSWGGARRIFNNGSLSLGGRLYGDWQQLKEEDRLQLTIDGKPVVEIDITACFLFIASALSGMPVSGDDPYSQVNWVKDEQTRKLCKRLVASIISKDGPLKQFPQGVRGEFSIPSGPSGKHLDDFQGGILDTFPVLGSLSTTGLKVMYRESETVLAAIETLAENGIVAYPVHDCLIVPEENKEEAISTLLNQLQKDYGSAPWMTVGYSNGREEKINPENYLSSR